MQLYNDSMQIKLLTKRDDGDVALRCSISALRSKNIDKYYRLLLLKRWKSSICTTLLPTSGEKLNKYQIKMFPDKIWNMIVMMQMARRIDVKTGSACMAAVGC